MLRTSLLGDDPRPLLPRRIVPDVLRMPALQVGNPVADVVDVKSNNAARNGARHHRIHARRRTGMCTVTAEPSVRNAESGVCRRTDASAGG